MTTFSWVLVLGLYGGHSGVALTVIEHFRSAAECEKAAEQIAKKINAETACVKRSISGPAE